MSAVEDGVQDADRTQQRTGAQLNGHPAGLVSRLCASAVDLIVVIGLMGAVYLVIAGGSFLIHPRHFEWPENIGWSIPVVGAVLAAPYLAIAWSNGGRTVGDSLFGLRVVTRRGRRVHLPRALVRALLDLLFPLGLVWIPFSGRRASIQDLLLNTAVIYDWRSRSVDDD
jgi:uncharacterized RDD family membrane protein YckC